MRREWYWGSSKTIASTSSVPSTTSTTTTTTTKKKNEEMSSINKGTQPGCMSGVLHLFDFHQFQFPITTQSPCFKTNAILQDDPTFTKGVEAPRNSLESESSPMFSTELKEEEDFHVPVEIRVPIATSAKDKEFGAGKTRNDGEVSCSDSSSSPGPKTPSLVARLMGLDLLPDTLSPYPSPSPSSRKSEEIYRHNVQQQQQQRQNQNQTTNNKQRKKSRNNSLMENEMRYETTGSRSLPDTPRISSARRSDVDARFSLQINNKENMINNGDEFDYLNRISRDEKSRQNELRNEEDSRSPGHYARQIVKQVKESVSRRVGLDITNTTNKRFNTKEEVEVVLLKSKKPKRLSKIGEESTSNSPPRLRLFCEETKSAAFRDQVSLPQKLSSSKPYSSSSPPISRLECNKVKSKFSAKPKSKSQAAVPQQEKCKKASCERFTQRKHVGRSSEPEKKSQSTHGSKEIAARRSSSSTEPPSSSSTLTSTSTSTSTSISSCQIQGSKEINSRLSSSSSHRTTWSWCVSPLLNDSNNDPTNFADEIRYVSEILKCTGIHKHTLVSFTQWFSPSHPLDPSIFLYLENDTVPIKHRCNRRLLFNLMDEMLANFLKPYLNMKPWFEECNQFVQNGMRGEALLQWLCDEIRRFPSSNCENLEDIDSLIDRDLPDERIRTLPLCEETESIVFEIEQNILDTLVHETAADIIVKQKRRV